MRTDPTTDRATLLTRIAEVASDLCDPHQHVEPRGHEWTPARNRRTLPPHRVTLPGLLAQLRDAVTPTASGEYTAGGHAASRPPCNVDALSRYATISLGAIRWCWDQGIELRDTDEANIGALVGAAGSMDSDQQAALLDDLRRWRAWATAATDWATPPVTPTAPCPVCGTWSSLRVRVERDGDTMSVRSAYCTGTHDGTCDAVWDDDAGINALAAHIAAHARSSRQQAAVARQIARARQDEQDKQRWGPRSPAA